MKKTFVHILFLSITNILCSQAIRDTVEVSKRFKTIVIFPDDIAESVIGNEMGFTVDLPKTNGSKFNGRILKLYYDDLAKNTMDITNHTVITQSGNVYDFILRLVDRPKKLTWYVKPQMAITNIDSGKITFPQTVQSSDNKPSINGLSATSNKKEHKELREPPRDSVAQIATRDLYEKDPEEYYRLRCYYMQFDKAKIPRYFARKDNVFLWLKGVYYNENEIYVQLRIENKEGLDLDINFLKYFIASSYKNTTKQKIPITKNSGLLYEYKVPKTVKGNTENHFVVVFKKFTLDDKKELLFEMDEESGNRNLTLRVGHETINNPKRF
ncbi:DUF4138 domain-containing protein [Flagellimonas pacifica]|uniref:DUF4138 domain-containing protein n=1 Tax=Flagellimonas pacifica TaxID=1247520 RepID=A0A285MVS5_9FLAO|nr:DUF4138 domain-containing protein [Allomuricauda parva]SNZ01302.1 protein of unknown function [Allomuricauda parva]